MHKNSLLKKLKNISLGAAMADMALLLLIFFMATTSTEPPEGVEVDLPVAETRGAEQDSIYITIGKNGNIYFDGEKILINRLYENLVMREREKDHIVSITADKNLNYEVVVQILTILQEMDFLNVVFMSEPRKGEEKTASN